MVNNGLSISLIIPVYKVESYIQACIESVMSQTYNNFECIIVDDCGGDKSIEIAKNLVSGYTGDIEFTFLKNEKNSGISVSRNSAMKIAKGEFLYFLDSDDCLSPNALSSLIEKVKKYPEVDLVQGNFELQDPNDYRKSILCIEDKSFPEYMSDKNQIGKTMLHWTFPVTSTNKLVRTSIVIENNLFFMEGIVHEDEFWRWLIYKYIKSLSFALDKTYWYRTNNETSIMNNPDLTKSYVSRIKIFEYIALHADSQNDICFGVHFLSYEVKVSCWKFISNKKLAKEQLNSTIRLLETNNVDSRLKRNLYFHRLPVWIMNNRLFTKFYCEYEKHNNLIYAFS